MPLTRQISYVRAPPLHHSTGANSGWERAAWTDLALVFPSAVGTPLNGSNLLARHYAILAGTGLPRVTWHDLRHSTATMLLEAGVHPRMVAERLGHATPALVMNVYGHVTERMQREATAAMEAALGSPV